MPNTKFAEILLVEDNPNDVELTLHIFDSIKTESNIHVVRDGAEALDYLFCLGNYANRDSRDLPRLILLDLKLPKIGGLEVLRRIREYHRTRLIPVAVLTSSKQPQDIAEAYELGANSYVVKPVCYDEFSDVIEQLCHYWLITNEAPLACEAMASQS